MPDELTARARAVVEGDPSWTVPPTRDAATVVLLRDAGDGEGGFEVFVLRRVSSMAFAAGMHVFPGGVVEPGDADVPWHPGTEPDARRLTASPGLARALVAAAVRETFEECGALLATDAEGVAGGADEAARVGVLDGSVDFAGLLRRTGLAVDAGALQPWDHWITPEVEPRRYDTRFFLAALPAGQRAVDVGGEADRVRWVRPDEAVRECEAGRMPMLPPTYAVLSSLRGFATAAEALAAAPQRDIRPLLPHPFDDGSGGVRWALVDARDGSEVGPA